MSFTTIAFASFGTSATVPLDLNNYDSNTVPGDSGFTNGFSIQFGTSYGDIRDFEENSGSGLTAYMYDWGSNAGKMHSDDSICPETSTSTQMTAVMEFARSRNTTSAGMNWWMGIRDTGAFGAFNYDFLALNIVTNAGGSVQLRPEWDDPGGHGFTGSFTTFYPTLSEMTAGAFVRIGFQQADDELYAWFEHLDGSNYTIWGPVTHSYTSGSAQTLNAATFSGQTHRRVTHIGDVASTGTDPFWIRNIAYYDGLYYGVGGTVVSAASMSLSGDTSVNAGSAHTYTVTVFDGSNDTATDYTGTVTWTQSASSVSQPSTYTFTAGDAGTKDFGNVIWYDAQETPSAFTVTDSDSGISAGLSISIATVLGSITMTGDTTPQANVNQVYTVTIFDSSGRTYADYTGTVLFTQSGSSVVYPSSYTFTGADAGQQPVTGFLFYDATETSRLTVYDQSQTTINAALLIDPIPGAVYYTEFDILPTAAELAEGVSSVVTMTDSRGNVITDYSATITIRTSDAASNVPSSFTFDGSEGGVKTFTGWAFQSDNTQTVAVLDASNAPLTSTSTDSIYIRPVWRDVTKDDLSYTAQSRYTQVWQQVSVCTYKDTGVDFILRVEEQYPMVISDVQPAYLIESGDTGRP